MLNRFRAFACLVVSIFLALTIGAHPAFAEPLDPKAVPDPLKPWITWASGEKVPCSALFGLADQSICAWPSHLALTLDEHGGHFVQTWHVESRSWIRLVGDAKRWPFSVKIDGARAVVLERGSGPEVEVQPGDHKIEGALLWDTMPESIHVPPETGLLSLNVRGADVAFPNRDAAGPGLSREDGDGRGRRAPRDRRAPKNRRRRSRHCDHACRAQRRREKIVRSFSERDSSRDSFRCHLVAPLPARVEPDGHLRVQVRPGRYVIELVARSEKSLTEIKRPAPDGPWREGEEVWVFQANPLVRAVSIEGVAAIDPQQTSLPEDWKRLPAYPVRTTDVFRLTERRRGDTDAPPDRLALNRAMWLDFDGASLTVSDDISGTLERSARLEMATPTVLGRVAIGGRDQFITRLSGKDGVTRSGVEVREGALRVNADSRIVSDPSDIPAVGWDHDFHEVSATLHLPPGFRLLYASGVDDVPNTWLKHWTLLEIFLAIILALAVFRLRGPLWGVLALVTFALTFPEGDAPKWIWIAVVALEAITRALPVGKPKKIFGWLRIGSVALVALMCIPFLVTHVRQGMYPAQGAASSDLGFFTRSTTAVSEDQKRALVTVSTPKGAADRDGDFEKNAREESPKKPAPQEQDKQEQTKLEGKETNLPTVNDKSVADDLTVDQPRVQGQAPGSAGPARLRRQRPLQIESAAARRQQQRGLRSERDGADRAWHSELALDRSPASLERASDSIPAPPPVLAHASDESRTGIRADGAPWVAPLPLHAWFAIQGSRWHAWRTRDGDRRSARSTGFRHAHAANGARGHSDQRSPRRARTQIAREARVLAHVRVRGSHDPRCAEEDAPHSLRSIGRRAHRDSASG